MEREWFTVLGTAESPSAVRKAQGSIPYDTYFVQLPGSMFVGVGETVAVVVVVAVGVLVLVAVLVGMASTQ